MRCTLMHKHIPVAELVMDESIPAIQQIAEVYDVHHFPLSAYDPAGTDERNRRKLNNWWKNRLIPASRSGFRQRMNDLGIESREELLLRCYSLSLSDQYWIRPGDTNLTWDQVNFFSNDFSDDVGNILFGEPVRSEAVDLMSPCNTSDGVLKKKWKIVNGRRRLIKGGSRPFLQEPFNEAAATKIQRAFGSRGYVEYELAVEGKDYYSVCDNFISPDLDFVNAWAVYSAFEKEQGKSQYEHFLYCCAKLEIPGVQQLLDHVLALDFIIANTDRHFGNFGFLRDANTLKFIGPAPVFDNGSSMWHKEVTSMIMPEGKLNSRPFEDYGGEQLELVSSLVCLDWEALKNMEAELHDLYAESIYLDEKRVETLCGAYRKRIEELERWGDRK